MHYLLNMLTGIQCAGCLYPVLQTIKHRLAQTDQLNKCNPEVRITKKEGMLRIQNFIMKLDKHTLIAKLAIKETFLDFGYPKLIKLLKC